MGSASPHCSGARDRGVSADSHTEWLVGAAKWRGRATMASLAVARQRRCAVFRPFRDEPARSVVVYHHGHDDAENPYFLYAASNVGSLTALLLYPLAIESILGISWQTRIWSIGYAAFIPLMLGCAWLAWNSRPALHADVVPYSAAGRHTWIERGTWILLAFVPSSLMLGVTTHLSNVVAPIPLLWTFPLALYLLTFILAFARRPIALSTIERVLPYVLLPLVLMLAMQLRVNLVFYLALNLLAFFALALVCHSRLALLRPSHLRLTEFYLCLSIGGALGGIFNTFVAPSIFPDLGEYPLAIVFRLPRDRYAARARSLRNDSGLLLAARARCALGRIAHLD